MTGEPLEIRDVYSLPDDATYRQNRSFDEKFGYRTKSMLTIPMRTHRDEVIGVAAAHQPQAVRRRAADDAPTWSGARWCHSTQRAVELVSALASQAAVAIENSRLYEDIERLFEGFVTASVTAIESPRPDDERPLVARRDVHLRAGDGRSTAWSSGPYAA